MITLIREAVVIHKGTSKNPFERKRASPAEYFVKSPRLALLFRGFVI